MEHVSKSAATGFDVLFATATLPATKSSVLRNVCIPGNGGGTEAVPRALRVVSGQVRYRGDHAIRNQPL